MAASDQFDWAFVVGHINYWLFIILMLTFVTYFLPQYLSGGLAEAMQQCDV